MIPGPETESTDVPYKEIGDEVRRLCGDSGLRRLAREKGIQHSILADVWAGRRRLAPYVARLASLGFEVFGLADREEALELADAKFRYCLAQGILAVACGARTLVEWTETVEGSNEDRWLAHQLEIDWDTAMTSAEVIADIKNEGRRNIYDSPDSIARWAEDSLTAEQRAEIEKAVAERREIEKARQAALREDAEAGKPAQ